MNTMDSDTRYLRSDVCKDDQTLLGCYYPLSSYSWHNNDYPPNITLGTIMHEGIHSTVISSTAYQRSLLHDFVNR